jgi:hypothetical protein
VALRAAVETEVLFLEVPSLLESLLEGGQRQPGPHQTHRGFERGLGRQRHLTKV